MVRHGGLGSPDNKHSGDPLHDRANMVCATRALPADEIRAALLIPGLLSCTSTTDDLGRRSGNVSRSGHQHSAHPISSPRVQSIIAVAGFLLVVFIFYRTGFVQVPQHRQLANEYDRDVCRDLITSNWWRTIAWTTRSAIVLYLFVACATFGG